MFYYYRISDDFHYTYENFNGTQENLNFPWKTSVGVKNELNFKFNVEFQFPVESS